MVSGRWLGEVARGKIFGNPATEVGNRAVGESGLETVLRASADGGLRLSGIEYYSTGSTFSDYVVVYAADEEAGRSALWFRLTARA